MDAVGAAMFGFEFAAGWPTCWADECGSVSACAVRGLFCAGRGAGVPPVAIDLICSGAVQVFESGGGSHPGSYSKFMERLDLASETP